MTSEYSNWPISSSEFDWVMRTLTQVQLLNWWYDPQNCAKQKKRETCRFIVPIILKAAIKEFQHHSAQANLIKTSQSIKPSCKGKILGFNTLKHTQANSNTDSTLLHNYSFTHEHRHLKLVSKTSCSNMPWLEPILFIFSPSI